MTFWTIAANDIKLTVKDKMFFFWFMAFPLLFALIFGLAFPESSSQVQQATINVLDYDDSVLSRTLIEELQSDRYSVNLLDNPDEKNMRTLIIPEGFSKNILDGQKVEILLEKEKDSNMQASQAAYVNILKAVIQIIARLVILDPSSEQELSQDYAQTRIKGLVSLKTQMAGELEIIPSGFNHTIPAISVMFILFTVLMYGGIIILQERREGQLERMYLSPATYASIVGGKWVSRVILGMAQVIFLFIAGKIIFKTYYGNAWAALVLIAFLMCAAIAGLSIFLGSIIRKEETLIVLNILVANIMAALGGCWFPMELIPSGLRKISYIFPSGWTMDAFHKLIFYGYNLKAVITHIVALAGFTLFFLFLAVKFFKIRRT